MSIMSEYIKKMEKYEKSRPQLPKGIKIPLEDEEGEIFVEVDIYDFSLRVDLFKVDMFADTTIYINADADGVSSTNLYDLIEWFEESDYEEVVIGSGTSPFGRLSLLDDGHFRFVFIPFSDKNRKFEYLISKRSMKKLISYLKKIYV